MCCSSDMELDPSIIQAREQFSRRTRQEFEGDLLFAKDYINRIHTMNIEDYRSIG
jgi:hypothetical protein